MSPERAEEIFYEAYRAGLWGRVGEPLVQRELRMSCWKAVVDAVESEYAAEIARRYLANGGGEDGDRDVRAEVSQLGEVVSGGASRAG